MQYNIIFTVTIPNFYWYDLWHISHIPVKNVKRDLLRFKLGLSNKSSKIIIDSLSLSHSSGPEWSEWKFMWSCYFLGNFFYFNNIILKNIMFSMWCYLAIVVCDYIDSITKYPPCLLFILCVFFVKRIRRLEKKNFAFFSFINFLENQIKGFYK